MSADGAAGGEDPSRPELKRYADLLSPLFEPRAVNTLEFAQSLLRVGGHESAGWDTLLESREVLGDLVELGRLPLPGERFREASKTRWRLALVSYVHLTEMDAPYHVLANLLRVRLKLGFHINPFYEIVHRKLERKKRKGKEWLRSPPPPTPNEKIGLIRKRAEDLGLTGLPQLFEEFYFPDLRNSVAHSDYILHGNEFRMARGYLPSAEGKAVLTQAVPVERLQTVIQKAFDFYSAFFALEQQARRSFSSLKGKCFPYNLALKGLLEFLVDPDGFLCGFKVHWPNGHDSIYRRTPGGCESLNLSPELDGSINFYVGEFFRDHDPFSPLVERGTKPQYTPADGNAEPLAWPAAAKVDELTKDAVSA